MPILGVTSSGNDVHWRFIGRIIMLRKNFLTLRVLTIVGFLGFSPLALAQANEVANPGFATDLSGWNQLSGTFAEWSSIDADNNNNSGSALINNAHTTSAGTPAVLTQCFPVQGGEQILFGGDVVVPGGELPGISADIIVFTYESSDCTGLSIDFDFASSDTTITWNRINNTLQAGEEIRSVGLSLGVARPFGTTGNGQALFDNIFLHAFDPDSGAVSPAMSASWFNPAESGHGIMIHLLDGNSAWMCWFTFTLAGEPAWICGIGTIVGNTITFEDAFTVEGGAFPPNFDPAQILERSWGSITVTFSGCNTGFMTWTTSAQGFTTGSMPLQRLTTLWGVSCP